MELKLIILSMGQAVLLTASVAFNFYQSQKMKKIRRERPESYEVKDLMRDLAGGRALVKMERVDPVNVILRSPRELQ